jgi:hypothetical protein
MDFSSSKQTMASVQWVPPPKFFELEQLLDSNLVLGDKQHYAHTFEDTRKNKTANGKTSLL